MRFEVWGLGFGVWGLGFGVWGLGFRVWGFGFGVSGLGSRAAWEKIHREPNPLAKEWVIARFIGC